MKPFISVIIPTLNEEKYIERTLKSLKNQDFNKKFEIIVSDSRSKDKTVKIARKYADRVVVIDKRTVGAGRNAGAKAANGEVLIFLDADTIPMYNFINKFDETFKDKKVVATTCPILPDSYTNIELIGTWLLNMFLLKTSIKLGKPVFPGICFACRKDAFNKAGGYDETMKLVEDIEFSSRLRKIKGKYKFIQETFVISSTRRHKKWGPLKIINAWPFGYIQYKVLKKTPDYPPVR
ncbi:MAG: glycosyltransferase [Candidatus Aenigmarchaeota archaeon]|nr:glycosyltransferase [Candidatus Aenigmarchaeota archaeon]